METEVAQHLIHNYGDRAFAVAALATNTGRRWPLMGVRLAYPHLYIEAEVRFACQREYACTAVVRQLSDFTLAHWLGCAREKDSTGLFECSSGSGSIASSH